MLYSTNFKEATAYLLLRSFKFLLGIRICAYLLLSASKVFSHYLDKMTKKDLSDRFSQKLSNLQNSNSWICNTIDQNTSFVKLPNGYFFPPFQLFTIAQLLARFVSVSLVKENLRGWENKATQNPSLGIIFSFELSILSKYSKDLTCYWTRLD